MYIHHITDYCCLSLSDDDPLDVAAEVISNQRVLLSQKLSSDDLMDYLIAEKLVDNSAGEKLGMMCFTPMEKNRVIITSLLKGPPGTLKKFCAILRKVKKYGYIADELEKGYYQLLEYIRVVYDTLQKTSNLLTKVSTSCKNS